MNESQNQDWLEALLKQAQDEIEDAGFASRVLQALPLQSPGRRYRFAVVMAFTALACLLCFFFLPAGQFIWESVLLVFNPNSWISASVSIGSLVMVAMVIWGALSVATASE